jgi:hypothetical protein
VSDAAFNLARMEATFASSLVGLVKDSLGLKLDTPFKLLASLICCLTFFGGQRTPLQSTGWALSWLGWHNGARWVEPARQWLTGPSHIQCASSVFVLLAAIGVGFATFGTRAPFFAWLGICGLIEIGATVAAWGWPIAAFLATSVIGRIQDRKSDRYRWDHSAMTFLALAAACLHLPATVIAVIIGEKQRAVPPTVRVELSYEGRRDLDKRLAAMGFPSVGPRPHSGRRAHPMPLTMPERRLTASDGAA